MAALCLLVQALIYRVVPTKERVLFSESSVIGGGGTWLRHRLTACRPGGKLTCKLLQRDFAAWTGLRGFAGGSKEKKKIPSYPFYFIQKLNK